MLKPFGELALFLLYNFHHKHNFIEFAKIKKQLPKINVKNIKQSSFIVLIQSNLSFIK